jgi:hypothetical protein
VSQDIEETEEGRDEGKEDKEGEKEKNDFEVGRNGGR